MSDAIITAAEDDEREAIVTAVTVAMETIALTMGMVQVCIQRAVQAGRLLERKKGEMEYGEWSDWLEVNCLGLTPQTARRWMALARFDERFGGRLEHAGTITQAYRMAGLLPDPESSSPAAKASAEASYLTQLTRGVTHLSAAILSRPLEKWTVEERVALKHRIEPFVELYDKL
jgi:Protein of unknown function (DUF3102)